MINPTELSILRSREYYETKRPGFCRLGLVVIIFFVICLVTWSLVFSIEDVAYGWVITRPESSTSLIRAGVTGIIEEISVFDGDRLVQGDVLLQINVQEYKIQLDDLVQRLNERESTLDSTRCLLYAINNPSEQPVLQNPYFEALWVAFSSEYRLWDNRIQVLEYEIENEINKPTILRSSVTLERMELSLQGEELGLNSWLAEKRLSLNQEIKYLSEEIANLRSQVKILEKQISDGVVRAPISGRAHEVAKLNPGDRITENQPILQVIPSTNEFITARVEVSPAEILTLQEGMSVVIRFDSLPTDEYEPIKGFVKRIFPDFSTSEQGMPVYLLEVEIPSFCIDRRTGARLEIPPGITGEARIIRSERRIIYFILEVLDWV